MAEDEEKLKQIQVKYGIVIKENDKLPYQERIQRECVDKKFFYYYKKNRLESLADKIPDREEPFHKKYAKAQKEKELLEKMREAKMKALMEGDIESARQINVNFEGEQELLEKLKSGEKDPKEKFKKWMNKKKELFEKIKSDKEKTKEQDKKRSILRNSILIGKKAEATRQISIEPLESRPKTVKTNF